MQAPPRISSESGLVLSSCTVLLSHATRHARRFWISFFDHWPLALCLLAYFAVALLYGVTIPIFETPDANGHYAYIHELTESRGLPVQGTPSGNRVTGYVASHPPLYYALCAAVTSWVPDDLDFDEWAWRNPRQAMGDAGRTVNKNILIHTAAERFPWQGTPLTMHIARLVSTLLGACVVVSTYGITMELFPNRRWLALAATALAAFNPMFIFTSARVSNDAAVTAFGSLTVWGAVRLAMRGLSRKSLVLTGTALGFAVLSKLSGLVFVPVVALALFFDSLRIWHRQSTSSLLRRVGKTVESWSLVGLTALGISGWWFLRNVILYNEVMGVDAWLSRTATVRPEPIGVLGVVPELRGLEKSYWAMFGWFNISVAPSMYRFWWLLVRASLVGLALTVLDQRSLYRFSRSTQRGLLVLAAAFLLNLASLWRFIMIVLGAQGRYLMPAVAPISILLMLGLRRLLPGGASMDRWRDALSVTVGGAQLALTLVSLLLFILPAYAKPEIVQEGNLPDEMTRFKLPFDGAPIELIGGHIEVEDAHPGDALPVSLYWRATASPQEDYLAFVQILGQDMEPIAGVDCYPGRGNFPPTLWQPSVIYRDRYQLPIAPGAETPTAAVLHAGLNSESGERLAIKRPSDQRSQLLLLDQVAIRSREPLSDDVGYPVGARLGDAITLVGYDLSADRVKPGDTITVTLTWRAEKPTEADLTVFVHLIDEEGNLVTQSDHPPLSGAYPTFLWQSNDLVRDPHHLILEGTAPPGACTLAIGMYNPRTKERLPVYSGQGGARLENDAVVAGTVTIE